MDERKGEPICNLYRMRASVDELKRAFGPLANDTTNLPAYDAIYPDREAPILAYVDGALRLQRMMWGVPPPGQVSRPVTNVRNLASPFWRAMLSSPERRCLVPVTSFCEWTGKAGSKSKVWFGTADGAPFAFAGIWRPTEEEPRMAFLTCEPNEIVGAVHPKAMPVILATEDQERWLTGKYGEVVGLARPFPDVAMRIVEDERAATFI